MNKYSLVLISIFLPCTIVAIPKEVIMLTNGAMVINGINLLTKKNGNNTAVNIGKNLLGTGMVVGGAVICYTSQDFRGNPDKFATLFTVIGTLNSCYMIVKDAIVKDDTTSDNKQKKSTALSIFNGAYRLALYAAALSGTGCLICDALPAAD